MRMKYELNRNRDIRKRRGRKEKKRDANMETKKNFTRVIIFEDTSEITRPSSKRTKDPLSYISLRRYKIFIETLGDTRLSKRYNSATTSFH